MSLQCNLNITAMEFKHTAFCTSMLMKNNTDVKVKYFNAIKFKHNNNMELRYDIAV